MQWQPSYTLALRYSAADPNSCGMRRTWCGAVDEPGDLAGMLAHEVMAPAARGRERHSIRNREAGDYGL